MGKKTILLGQIVISLSVFFGPMTMAQSSNGEPDIHIIYMGGPDCPPCVAWRGLELPKLQKSATFNAIKFSYVAKSIKSAVPSEFFLPSEVKPYREKLHRAGGGMGGSSQTAVVVNGEIFDYYFGARSADDIVAMITSIKAGERYPFDRCVQFFSSGRRTCSLRG